MGPISVPAAVAAADVIVLVSRYDEGITKEVVRAIRERRSLEIIAEVEKVTPPRHVPPRWGLTGS
ncbi:MAG: hypothetical protein M3387_00835 [Actinomycetota bacterium]|nr:hypothetical protein [Actinomycetota bacterium]